MNKSTWLQILSPGLEKHERYVKRFKYSVHPFMSKSSAVSFFGTQGQSSIDLACISWAIPYGTRFATDFLLHSSGASVKKESLYNKYLIFNNYKPTVTKSKYSFSSLCILPFFCRGDTLFVKNREQKTYAIEKECSATGQKKEKNTNKNYQITCKQSIILNNRNYYGSFYLGPFVFGQGITVANALRRTLLSELTGIGIIAVEIKGATHEYANIPGVKETVLDILLNLKEIVLKANSRLDLFETVAFLQVRGPGSVYACDILLPPSLLCVDPDQYIATLAEDGVLMMKLYITPGTISKKNKHQSILDQRQNSSVNIRLSSDSAPRRATTTLPRIGSDESIATISRESLNIPENQENQYALKKQYTLSQTENLKEKRLNFDFNERKNSDVLYLDSVFMPVTKVNYSIEENPHDFSSQIIILEIWTNGSIHPRQALSKALKKLVNIFFYLSPFKDKRVLTNISKNIKIKKTL